MLLPITIEEEGIVRVGGVDWGFLPALVSDKVFKLLGSHLFEVDGLLSLLVDSIIGV